MKQYLVGKDPLEIDALYTRARRDRESQSAGTRTDGSAHMLMRAVSGIEMALWDLAGKLLGVPTTTLLGGRFATRCAFTTTRRRATCSIRHPAANGRRRSSQHPSGFTAHKFGFPHTDPKPTGPRPANRCSRPRARSIRKGFENCREAIGWDHDIMVHCHWEYDLRTSIQLAEAVEPIRPLWLEDPLPPEYAESWRRLCQPPSADLHRRDLVRRQGFKDFIINQGCDIVNPDLRNTGGFLESKRIADMADSSACPWPPTTPAARCTPWRLPLGRTIRDFVAVETVTGQGGWMDQLLAIEGPYVKNGFIQVTDKPGLGIELNPDVVKAHLAEGERWWG